MDNFDLNEFIKLADIDLDKATKMLSDYLGGLTPGQRGAAYVNLASVYMDLLADNQEQLALVLDQQLAALKELDKQERRDLEGVDLELTRNQLKE